jgi:integrase
MKTTGTITRRASGWVVNLNINGKRRQLSAQTKAEAEQRLSEALQQPRTQSAVVGPFTLRHALRKAIDDEWDGSKPDHRSAVSMAQQILEFFGPDTHVVDITYQDAERLIEWGKARNNQPSTINNRLSRLRKLQEMALKFGGATNVPRLPKNLKLSNIQLQTFQDDQIKRVAACLYGRGRKDEARLFVFLSEMGCRFSEAMRLKGESIDLERSTVTFFKPEQDNKNGNRLLKLTPRALEMVEQQMPALPSQKLWILKYDSFYKLVVAALDELGINMPRPIHTARHTCGSKLGRAGLNDYMIRDWLGHSSTQTTNRYVHLNAEALDACWEVLAGK